jgi:hypothetical protein
MKIELLDELEYGNLFGLSVDQADEELVATLADHWRWAVWRNGISLQGRITFSIHQRLEAVGFVMERARELTKSARENLIQLGEIAEVSVAGTTQIAPTAPRLIRLGDDTSALVGALPTRLVEADLGESLVRRFSPKDVEIVSALSEAGATDYWPLGDWATSARFPSSPHFSSLMPLASITAAWKIVEEELRNESQPVSDLNTLRVLCGCQGTFFGRPFEPGNEGRWEKPHRPGVWIGRRRGYQENHSRPTLVFVDQDGGVKSADFYDEEEYRWAVVAMGVENGASEIVRFFDKGDLIEAHCSFPPSLPLKRLLTLCGDRVAAWAWALPKDVYPELEKLLEVLGASCIHGITER